MLRYPPKVFNISQYTMYDGRRCVASVAGVASRGGGGGGDGDIWPATQPLDGRKSQH